MLRRKTNVKSKTAFLILLSVGLVLAAVGVIFKPVDAQTWVEGHLTQDTTWIVEASPYRAVNDVIVDPGVLLTIEPGVEVQFADGFSLIVEGSLDAAGTDVNPIVFTSSRVQSSPGVWNTIKFNGSSIEQFFMTHTKVEYAAQGVTVESLGPARIEESEIYNCSIAGVVCLHASLSRNSICHNSIGIIYTGMDNLANYNDIYGNFEGMRVTSSAAVNAEYNYWGHSSGPYHPFLNPQGEGNSVNGDGTDLDFIPWLFYPVRDIQPPSLNACMVSLTLNQTPISSGGQVSVNVRVTDGTFALENAYVQMVSDKGGSFSPESGYTDSNGEFTTTFTAATVSEETKVKITAKSSISGYADGSDYEYVYVLPPDAPSLSVTVTANPHTIKSIEYSTVTIKVTDGASPISARIHLSSNGGTFSEASGNTDSNGVFTCKFFPLKVSNKTISTITVDATKTGYFSGQSETQVTVKPGDAQEGNRIDFSLVLMAVAAIFLLVVWVVYIARIRKNEKSRARAGTSTNTKLKAQVS